jgi:malate synthase
VTRELFHDILRDEAAKTPHLVGAEAYAAGKYAEGARLFEDITAADDYVEFLTLPAYRAID